MGKRKHRLNYAVKLGDTSMQRDLIAAGVEEGVIEFFKLEGKEATKLKGRSKIIFTKKSKRLLKGIEDDESNADLVSRASWLRAAAGHHTKLANRLINLARMMKPKGNDLAAEIDRQLVNGRTIKAYVDLAGRCSKKQTLTNDQKDQINENWKKEKR